MKNVKSDGSSVGIGENVTNVLMCTLSWQRIVSEHKNGRKIELCQRNYYDCKVFLSIAEGTNTFYTILCPPEKVVKIQLLDEGTHTRMLRTKNLGK